MVIKVFLDTLFAEEPEARKLMAVIETNGTRMLPTGHLDGPDWLPMFLYPIQS